MLYFLDSLKGLNVSALGDFQGVRVGTERVQRKQSTPTKHVEQFDSRMILQGVEGSRAWSMLIAKETGKMSATVADNQAGFVVFGACTPF
jgi:hypothetical protein